MTEIKEKKIFKNEQAEMICFSCQEPIDYGNIVKLKKGVYCCKACYNPENYRKWKDKGII